MKDYEFKVSRIKTIRQETIENYEKSVLERKPHVVQDRYLGEIDGIERVMIILGIEYEEYDSLEIYKKAREVA